jgi:tetratricopeptide (TPR) repeat protein
MKYLLSLIILASLLYANKGSDEVKAYYSKSYDYEKMGKYGEAIKVLIPDYKKYPKRYTVNLRFGWLFYLDKKYTSSIKYYKKASLLNTYALPPKLGLIRIYLDTGSYEDAQSVANEVLKVDYYNYYANLYMAKSLIAEKKYDIATKVINKMLALYPINIDYLEQLAVVYKMTNSKHLQKLYEEILILDPNNVLAH